MLSCLLVWNLSWNFGRLRGKKILVKLVQNCLEELQMLFMDDIEWKKLEELDAEALNKFIEKLLEEFLKVFRRIIPGWIFLAILNSIRGWNQERFNMNIVSKIMWEIGVGTPYGILVGSLNVIPKRITSKIFSTNAFSGQILKKLL